MLSDQVKLQNSSISQQKHEFYGRKLTKHILCIDVEQDLSKINCRLSTMVEEIFEMLQNDEIEQVLYRKFFKGFHHLNEGLDLSYLHNCLRHM